MSDLPPPPGSPQGPTAGEAPPPGWWLASDGKYYPPQQAPAPPAAWGSNVPPEKQRGGCLKYGLLGIVAFVGLIVVIVIIALVALGRSTTTKVKAVRTYGGIQSNSLNGTHPPQADINADATKCAVDALGDAGAKGTLTNHSSKQSNYLITVRFTDASGTQFGNGNAAVQNVLPGSTATWDATGVDKPSSASWKCTVAQVERLASTP
jgi:hypothetical protein